MLKLLGDVSYVADALSLAEVFASSSVQRRSAYDHAIGTIISWTLRVAVYSRSWKPSVARIKVGFYPFDRPLPQSQIIL